MKRQKDKNFRTGRIKNLPIIAVLTFLMFVMTFGMAFAEDSGIDYTDRPNLKNAVDLYLGTGDGSQLEIVFLNSGASWETIEEKLKELNGKDFNGPEKPTIVYAPSGTYHVTGKSNLGSGDVAGIKIPRNVIFVAEADSIFYDEKNSVNHPLILLRGSLYGGRFECGKKVNAAIKFANNTNYNSSTIAPSGNDLINNTGKRLIDGNVEHVEVVAPAKSGIQAINTQGINITHNIVRDGNISKTTGIGINYSAKAKNISYNTIKNIGSKGWGSAISLSHADATNIIGNKISNIGGHGISTDVEQGKAHAYCRVDYISNNVITGTGKHGIWLERGCQITKGLIGNTIKNANYCGIAAESGATVKKKWVEKRYVGSCDYTIKSMRGNTVYNSKLSGFSLTGKNAKVVMSKDNAINKSRTTNVITLDKGAKLYISGEGNKITNGKGNGILLKNRSYLKVTGKKTVITRNRSFGINVTSKSQAVVKNTYAKGNKKIGSKRYSFRYCKGTRFTWSKNCKKDRVVKTNSRV